MTECDGDCNDAAITIHPGAPEVCDGADNDCDDVLGGDEIDDDVDGQTECDGDCDDADVNNFDGNPEVCDGTDTDEDGTGPLRLSLRSLTSGARSARHEAAES